MSFPFLGLLAGLAFQSCSHVWHILYLSLWPGVSFCCFSISFLSDCTVPMALVLSVHNIQTAWDSQAISPCMQGTLWSILIHSSLLALGMKYCVVLCCVMLCYVMLCYVPCVVCHGELCTLLHLDSHIWNILCHVASLSCTLWSVCYPKMDIELHQMCHLKFRLSGICISLYKWSYHGWSLVTHVLLLIMCKVARVAIKQADFILFFSACLLMWDSAQFPPPPPIANRCILPTG
jgi:hypothetical protein